MKISMVIIIILLAAGFGVPGWIGGTFETRVRTGIEEANAGGAVVLELTMYDRGWFQTSGILEARFSEAYVRTSSSHARSRREQPRHGRG
ncbi:MAG: DUF945 family protein [Gammaproteobacteria bacterium]|nr:DUF945 family protein [Gammaproteobacteria bacterium]